MCLDMSEKHFLWPCRAETRTTPFKESPCRPPRPQTPPKPPISGVQIISRSVGNESQVFTQAKRQEVSECPFGNPTWSLMVKTWNLFARSPSISGEADYGFLSACTAFVECDLRYEPLLRRPRLPHVAMTTPMRYRLKFPGVAEIQPTTSSPREKDVSKYFRNDCFSSAWSKWTQRDQLRCTRTTTWVSEAWARAGAEMRN